MTTKFRIAALVTFLLFGLASYLPWMRMWGLNHLAFLPTQTMYLYGLAGVLLLWLLWGRRDSGSAVRVVEYANRFLWGGGIRRRAALAVVTTAVFGYFRLDVHLLGDGYTCLAIFGQGEAYIHKWAEPGSIWLVRTIQSWLGGYTRETALTTFQFLSIISGGVFVFNILIIVGDLCRNARLRLLAFTTIVLGGSTLMFMGYVEFYALEWASSSSFLALAVRYLKKRGRLWPVVAAYAVAVLMHVQALYFLPALLYLLPMRVRSSNLRGSLAVVAATGTFAAGFAFIWLYSNRIEFEVLILPVVMSRPEYPGYTFFSTLHLTDIMNEVFIVTPNALLLLASTKMATWQGRWNRTTRFLLIASAGSLLFFVLFAAATTMGRDWDIMSLSLLCPLLLLFHRLSIRRHVPGVRILLVNLLIVVLMSGSFYAVAHRSRSMEARFETLLTEHNWNGWVILATHLTQRGDREGSVRIWREMERRVPDRRTLLTAYDYLDRGQFDEAHRLASGLLIKNPYNPHFMQLLANVYRKQGWLNEAEDFYQQALRLNPYHAPLMNELAQLYLEQQRFEQALRLAREAHTLEPEKTFITETLALVHIRLQDYGPASALADTLFLNDPHSAGAHLIKMIIALNTGDYETARVHYLAFLEYGTGRSDYERMRKYYKSLMTE